MNRRTGISLLVLGIALSVALIPLRPLRPAARSASMPGAGQSAPREGPIQPANHELGDSAEGENAAPDTPAVAGVELAQRTASPGGEEAVDATAALPLTTIMENLRTTFRLYTSRFGGNPVGSNPEIAASLNGGNPGRVVFIKAADGLQLSGAGELVDSWGTPFFFHQLSRTEMEIRSAGPDRQMWTGDDLVMR